MRYFKIMNFQIIRIAFCLLGFLIHEVVWAQTAPEKLTAAFKAFQNDPQLRHAIASLYVVDAATGKVFFDENESLGLVPASTIKVITSASAFELLGENFRYKTRFAYQKNKEAPTLLILPGGDPTLGSWRWPATKEEVVLNSLTNAIQQLGIKNFGDVLLANDGWNDETIPDGWIWQDIGNYYGAGAAKLNWRENQYDVILRSGKRIGDPVTIVKTIPRLYGYSLKSELTSAATVTGDNAYIYFPLSGPAATIRGTIPINQSRFSISGAMPSGANQFVSTLSDTLRALGILVQDGPLIHNNIKAGTGDYTVFHTITSPPLGSIIYWFNRKSVNLYGEALVRTIAYQNTASASSGKGLELIRDFWKRQGISETELNMADGSGLSPLNRVTTHAQVRVLQHARKQAWFNDFYDSLPLLHGIKMKSGTMRGVKGFCGYLRSKDGKEYMFAFLVNNYNGSPAAVTQKMYKVLDVMR